MVIGPLAKSPLSDNWGTIALLAESLRPFMNFQACRDILLVIAREKLNSPQLGQLTIDDIPHAFSLADSFTSLADSFTSRPNAFPFTDGFERVAAEAMPTSVWNRVFDRIARDPDALIEADKYCRLPDGERQKWLPHIASAAHRMVEALKQRNFANEQEESEHLDRMATLFTDDLPSDVYGAAKRSVADWGRERARRWQSEHPAASVKPVGMEWGQKQAAKRAEEEAATLEQEKATKQVEEAEAKQEEVVLPAKEEAATEAAKKAKPSENEPKHPTASPALESVGSSSTKTGKRAEQDVVEPAEERATEEIEKDAESVTTAKRAKEEEARQEETEPAEEQSAKNIEKKAESVTTTMRAEKPAERSVNEQEALQDSTSQSTAAVASVGPAAETPSAVQLANLTKQENEKRKQEAHAKRVKEEQVRREQAEAAKRAKKAAAERKREEEARRAKEEKEKREQEEAAKHAEMIRQSKDTVRAAANTLDDNFFNDGGESLSKLLRVVDFAHLDEAGRTLYLDVLSHACDKLTSTITNINKKTRKKLRIDSAKALTKATNDTLTSDFDVAKKIEHCTRILNALGKFEKELGQRAVQSIANAFAEIYQGDSLTEAGPKRLFDLLGSLGPWRDAKDCRTVEAIIVNHGNPADGSLTAEYYVAYLHPHWETAPLSDRLDKWLDAISRASTLSEANEEAVCQTIADSLAKTQLADKDLQTADPITLLGLASRLKSFPQCNDTLRSVWEHLSSEKLSLGRIRLEDLSTYAALLWDRQPDKLAEDQSAQDNIETVQNAAAIPKKVWLKVREMIVAGKRTAPANITSEEWERLLERQLKDVKDTCDASPWLMAYINKNAPSIPGSYNETRDTLTNSLISKRKREILDAITEFSHARLAETLPGETAPITPDSEASTDLEGEKPPVPQPSSFTSEAKKSAETGELILAITTALSANGKKAVKATHKVHKLIEKNWSDDKNRPDYASAGLSLIDDARWPKALSELLEKRLSNFRDLLRIPIDDQRSDKFNRALGNYFKDEREERLRVNGLRESMQHEPPQHIELMDLVRKFCNDRNYSPGSVADAQEYMLKESDQLRAHTLQNLTAHFFKTLNTPNKTLAASVEDLDIVKRREADMDGVRQLVRLTDSFQVDSSGSENYAARSAAQELRNQQRAMGIGNEDAQALCLRHPAVKDAYRQTQKPKWLNEQGLATIFQALDVRVAGLERIKQVGDRFIEVFRAAMGTKDQDEAMALANELRGIMKEWDDAGNNADWDEILTTHPEWPDAANQMLDFRVRKSLNLVRIPLDNEQSERFIAATRKCLEAGGVDNLDTTVAHERSQHRNLILLTNNFFHYYNPRFPLPNTMHEAQALMSGNPKEFRKYILGNVTDLILTILETPGKSLATYWSGVSTGTSLNEDDVKKLANAFTSFVSASDDLSAKRDAQALTDLQIELAIDDDDTVLLLLRHPKAEEVIFQEGQKPQWLNEEELKSLLKRRALHSFIQSCEEAFLTKGDHAAQLTDKLRDMLGRDWQDSDELIHALRASRLWRESDGINPLWVGEIDRTKDVLSIEVSPQQNKRFIGIVREYCANEDLDRLEKEMQATDYPHKDLLQGMCEFFHGYRESLSVPETTQEAQAWLKDSIDPTSEIKAKLKYVVAANVAADIVDVLIEDDRRSQTLAAWRQKKLDDLDIVHRRSSEDVMKLAKAVMALDKAWASGLERKRRDEELTILLTEKIGVASDERAKRLLLGHPQAAAIIKPPAGEDKEKWLDNLFEHRKFDIDRFMENLQRFSKAEGSEKLRLAYALTMQRQGVSEDDLMALRNYANELGAANKLVNEGVTQFVQAASRMGRGIGTRDEIDLGIDAAQKKPSIDNETLTIWIAQAMSAEAPNAKIRTVLDVLDEKTAEITSPEAEDPALYQLNSLTGLDGEIAEKIWSEIEKQRTKIAGGRKNFPGKEEMLHRIFAASVKKEVEDALSKLKEQEPIRAAVMAAALIRVGVPIVTNPQTPLPSSLAAAIVHTKSSLPCSAFQKIDEPMNGKMINDLEAALLSPSLNLKWEQDDILDQLPLDKRSKRIKTSDELANGLYFLRKCDSSNVAFFAYRDDEGKAMLLHKEITEMQRSGFDTNQLQRGGQYRVHRGNVPGPDISPQQDSPRVSKSDDADLISSSFEVAEFLGELPPQNKSDWKKIVAVVKNFRENQNAGMGGDALNAGLKRELNNINGETQRRLAAVMTNYYCATPENGDIPEDWEKARHEVGRHHMVQFAKQRGMAVTDIPPGKRPENEQDSEQREDDSAIDFYREAAEILAEAHQPNDWRKIVTAIENLQNNRKANMDDDAIDQAFETELEDVNDEMQIQLIEFMAGYYDGDLRSGDIPRDWETARTAAHTFYRNMAFNHANQSEMDISSDSAGTHHTAQEKAEKTAEFVSSAIELLQAPLTDKNFPARVEAAQAVADFGLNELIGRMLGSAIWRNYLTNQPSVRTTFHRYANVEGSLGVHFRPEVAAHCIDELKSVPAGVRGKQGNKLPLTKEEAKCMAALKEIIKNNGTPHLLASIDKTDFIEFLISRQQGRPLQEPMASVAQLNSLFETLHTPGAIVFPTDEMAKLDALIKSVIAEENTNAPGNQNEDPRKPSLTKALKLFRLVSCQGHAENIIDRQRGEYVKQTTLINIEKLYAKINEGISARLPRYKKAMHSARVALSGSQTLKPDAEEKYRTTVNEWNAIVDQAQILKEKLNRQLGKQVISVSDKALTKVDFENSQKGEHATEHSDLLNTLTPELKKLIPSSGVLSSFAQGGNPAVEVLGKGADINGDRVAVLKRNQSNSNDVFIFPKNRFNIPSVFDGLCSGQSIRVDIKASTPSQQASSAVGQVSKAESSQGTAKGKKGKKKK
ncbi:MAG: hypothetical protein V4568_06485 [Pseudomonadota bacterium]